MARAAGGLWNSGVLRPRGGRKTPKLARVAGGLWNSGVLRPRGGRKAPKFPGRRAGPAGELPSGRAPRAKRICLLPLPRRGAGYAPWRPFGSNYLPPQQFACYTCSSKQNRRVDLEPAPKPTHQLKLEQHMATITSIPTVVPTGTWHVDPAHSKVGFAVKHMGIATVR